MTAEDETARTSGSGSLRSGREADVWSKITETFFFWFLFFLNNKNCFCINLRDYYLKAVLPWFKRHIVFHLLHTHIHTLMLGVKPINERLCKDNDDNLMQGSQPRLRNSTQLDSVPHLSHNDSAVQYYYILIQTFFNYYIHNTHTHTHRKSQRN